MTYYNTPDSNDLRYPEPAQNVDSTSDAAANFSAAIAAYANVEEATEDEWLEFGSYDTVADVASCSPGTPTVLGDDWDDIPF